jgi:hypothetical protein
VLIHAIAGGCCEVILFVTLVVHAKFCAFTSIENGNG